MKFIVALMIFMVSLFAKININTASGQELKQLKGIGTSKAQAIIKYRKEHKFEKIKDIMKIKGIGKKLFKKIKDEISVRNETK